jgi:uncharacterized protein YjbJ (UPF0337 family)
MSMLDKVMGRVKQAAGDLTGDASLRRKGRLTERRGRAKEEAALAEEEADAKAQEVADLERRTAGRSSARGGAGGAGTGSQPPRR